MDRGNGMRSHVYADSDLYRRKPRRFAVDPDGTASVPHTLDPVYPKGKRSTAPADHRPHLPCRADFVLAIPLPWTVRIRLASIFITKGVPPSSRFTPSDRQTVRTDPAQISTAQKKLPTCIKTPKHVRSSFAISCFRAISYRLKKRAVYASGCSPIVFPYPHTA